MLVTARRQLGASAQQHAARNSHKNSKQNYGQPLTPNQRIQKRETGSLVVKTPFILNLTSKTHTPSPHPFSTENVLVYLSVSLIFATKIYFNEDQKLTKKVVYYMVL